MSFSSWSHTSISHRSHFTTKVITSKHYHLTFSSRHRVSRIDTSRSVDSTSKFYLIGQKKGIPHLRFPTFSTHQDNNLLDPSNSIAMLLHNPYTFPYGRRSRVLKFWHKYSSDLSQLVSLPLVGSLTDLYHSTQRYKFVPTDINELYNSETTSHKNFAPRR